MLTDPHEWRISSPGDLSKELPACTTGDVGSCIRRAQEAFPGWAATPLDERIALLAACRERLEARREELAVLISLETGKPLRESRLELGAVIAKFDLTFADAERYLRDEVVTDGPHPSLVRRRPRGVAAVIAPFNFPIHLGHGAAAAYLVAGNPVVFKPSPLATHTGAAYAAEMMAVLPPGVFEFLPGWGQTGRDLCLDPAVRSICFTGSVPVGRSLSCELAADYSKSLALELGGKNSVIVWADADLDAAAAAVADGMCLTAGQRCNATSRVIVHKDVAEAFVSRLLESVSRYVPGDPLLEETMLGPLISEAACARYDELIRTPVGDWILAGSSPREAGGKAGHFVHPAIVRVRDAAALDASALATKETFAPVLVVEEVAGESDAVARHDAWDFGLTASVFTTSDAVFPSIGQELRVGNLYQNLPTTFSPSTLPFGGWGASGNGHPGGRGFVRFTTEEQAVQWRGA